MPNRARNALLVLCNSIINDEKIRRVAPLSVEMLEADLRRYREIEAIVRKEMQEHA